MRLERVVVGSRRIKVTSHEGRQALYYKIPIYCFSKQDTPRVLERIPADANFSGDEVTCNNKSQLKAEFSLIPGRGRSKARENSPGPSRSQRCRRKNDLDASCHSAGRKGTGACTVS